MWTPTHTHARTCMHARTHACKFPNCPDLSIHSIPPCCLPPFIHPPFAFPLLLQKLELPWSEASKQPRTLPLPVRVINPAGQLIPFKPFTLSFELTGWSLCQSRGCWPFLPLSIPPGVQHFPGARHSPPKQYGDMTRPSPPPSRARP